MKITYVVIIILILALGYLYFTRYEFNKNDQIELGTNFAFPKSNTVYYKNISFTFSSSTTPFSKNPETGIEQFPVDVYAVAVSSVGENLFFSTVGDAKEFQVEGEGYVLTLVDVRDNVPYFVLGKR